MLRRCQTFGTIRVASRSESLRPAVTIVGGLVGSRQEVGRQIPRCRFTCLRKLKGRRYGGARLSARGGSIGAEGVAIGACTMGPGAVTAATLRGARRRPLLAPWQVSLAKSLMRQRLASTVAIADIAANCRLSLSYFERAFANSVGISPYAWLLEQRVAHAKDFLCIPAIPIVRIALDCGFTDQAHFTNTFTRRVGMSPRAWRNKHFPLQEQH